MEALSHRRLGDFPISPSSNKFLASFQVIHPRQKDEAMRVFITGIAGFLGSRLAHYLVGQDHQVAGCDTLIGGYLENIPEDAEFHQVDCQYLNAMKNLIADSDRSEERRVGKEKRSTWVDSN